MANCTNCRHAAVAPQPPAPLLQIRRGYRARWNDLAFSVETDAGAWTLRVQRSAGDETLYTAHRAAARAAQLAAADFVVVSVLGAGSRVSPDRLAAELKWQEHW